MAKSGPKPRFFSPNASREGAQGAPWVRPSHIKGEARVAWERIVALLSDRGSLDATDPGLVEAYAVTFAALRAVEKTLGEDLEVTIESPANGAVVNPVFNLLNQITSKLAMLDHALGLTPASQRFGAPAKGKGDKGSKWDGLLDVV